LKHYSLIFASLLLTKLAIGQVERMPLEGSITYMSSRNVYVKYQSTKAIQIGDTLFCTAEPVVKPCLVVANKSSISCICKPLNADKLAIGNVIIAYILAEIPADPVAKDTVIPSDITADLVRTPDSSATAEPRTNTQPKYSSKKARIRLSAASYNNFAGQNTRSTWRLSYQANGALQNHIKWSLDHYIVYRRSYDITDTFQNKFANAFKIYALSMQYQLGKKSYLSFGRRVNQRFSSVGAIDGLQFQTAFSKNVLVGVILGTRPRLVDYAFDHSLMQGGIYLGIGRDQSTRQGSIGIMEQRNGGLTDRRFAYLQYSDQLTKNITVFASAEIDLYKNVRDTISLLPTLTNLYLMVRYRLSKSTDISLAYDNRRNIIYYESYKNLIDQIIDQETRQGLRLSVNYRPTKKWSVGLQSSLRFQETSADQVKNSSVHVNYSLIPRIKVGASLNAGLLQTSYLNSTQYGGRLTKSFLKGKIYSEVNYRYVNYIYTNVESNTKQHIYGTSLSYQWTRALSLFFYWEQTSDQNNDHFLRLQTKVMYRF
jgi:hypothetical protein